MATHDYVISNASGAAVRADLNNALAAIVTNNSSATAPTTTYAYQWWADTGSSPAVMKLRNAANSAWITLFQLDGEWSTLAVENGTAAAPSIYFKDSGTDTGFYSPGTDQIGISTGGTSAVVVDASQRLLVGTSSARANFFNSTVSAGVQVEGTTSDNASLSITRNSNSADNGMINFAKTRGTTVGATTIVSNGDCLGAINFMGSDGTEFVNAASIEINVDGTPGSNDMPGRIVLSTTADGASGPTERMRIDNSGNVLLGATDTSTTSGDGTKINPGTGAAVSIVGAADTNANYAINVYSRGAGAYRFRVGYGGTVYATSTSITAVSDQTLKENIRDLETGLTEVMLLQPRRFDWKNGDASNVAGFIAQEVEQVLPELVSDFEYSENETKKALKMGDILPTLVKAIQEQQAMIAELQAEVAALKTP